MKYLVAGDSHGCFYDLEIVLGQAIKKYNIDACIQVGDFGFYVLCFDKYKERKFPVPVYAIDGNHEQHWWLKQQLDLGFAPIWKQNHNIIYVPRSTVWEVDGCKFGFLGGAMNVDQCQEGSTKKRTTNYILKKDVNEALEAFNNFGQLDFLITHSCPHSIGVGMEGHPCFLPLIERYIEKPFGITTGSIHDCGEEALKNLWEGLDQKPKNWIYGHFHCYYQKQVKDTVFTCVGSTDSMGGHGFTRPFIIDTVKKTFEAFPSDTLLNSKGFHSTRILEKNDYPI
jgi:predicted phosphodiesterase